MKTDDRQPTISDLPLDLFGGVDGEAETPEPVEHEPDGNCQSCGLPLTVGLATCAYCGAQNVPIPIVTSTPPAPIATIEEPAGSYPVRVGFAFLYMTHDIAGRIVRLIGAGVNAVIDWTLHASDSDRWR